MIDPQMEVIETEEPGFTLDGPIVLDMTEVRDIPVATGWHDFLIVDSKAEKPAGRPLQILVRADVDNEGDPENGRPIFLRLPLEPANEGDFRGQTRKFLKALGFDVNAVKTYATAQDLADEFVDARLQMNIKHKPDKDDKEVIYANAKGWKPIEVAEEEIPFG